MSSIDTRPEVVDISHYAGDTLTITVTVSDNLSVGMTWKAQVKRDRDLAAPDAEFAIVPVTGGASLQLTGAQTRQLAELGVLLTGRALRDADPLAVTRGATGMLRYQGQWDVQISNAGVDPIYSLAQGALTIDMDVSREAVV